MKKTILLTLLIGSYNLFAQVHSLKESIYFGLGKTSLTNGHKKKLDSVISLLKTSKTYVGEVKGYTCNIGSLKINRVISNLRAMNVLNYLVDRGVRRDNFSYTSFGESHNTGNNNTSQGRAQNRRTDVEVVLSLFDEPIAYTEDIKNREVNPGKNGTSTTKEPKDPVIGSAPPIELGPNFTEGKIPKAGSKVIKSSNGIVIEIDKNSLVSGSSEPIDLDFKDYTQNYDIIKKGFNTASGGCRNLSMIGAFSIGFTQEYQELSMNTQKPIIVSIPSEYYPEAKLYTNPRLWTIDTVNKLRYNEDKKAYEVTVLNNANVIGLFNDVLDTPKFLKVKIKGLAPENIKSYVIYDNCNISMCCRQTKKWLFFTSTSYLVPISTPSNLYRIRSTYTDFSSKNGASYSTIHDIKNLDLSKLKKTAADGILVYDYPEVIEVKNQKLDKSSLCDDAPASN